MSVFDSAWSLLKNFDEKRGPMRVDPDGIDGPTTQEELDASDTVFYEDYGPVPASDYYNADWHINHPNSHIFSVEKVGKTLIFMTKTTIRSIIETNMTEKIHRIINS